MKFSIITASFNPGEKLLFTINSILEQGFRDFEIIVKDGGKGGAGGGRQSEIKADHQAG